MGMDGPRLADVFLSRAGARAKAFRDRAALGRELAKLVAEAHRVWPTLAISDDAFLGYVAERLPEDDPARGLSEVYASDLYLACGCARGDERALALFERTYFSDVTAYVGRVDHSLVDEVRQSLRVRLLTSRDDKPPQIVKYSGSGALGGWLRTACVRTLRDLKRAQKHHLPIDEHRDAGPLAHDPELEHLKRRHGTALDDAFTAVLSALPPEDRNILALRYLDGLSSDGIAELLGLDGSTVRRRITRLRERLLEETRALLAQRLKLRSDDCDSLIRLMRSQMAVSVARHLR